MSVMQLSAILMVGGFAFITGVVTLLGYMIMRMMGSDGWDDSNITNALRLLSHVTLHPEDFGKMYYLSDVQRKIIMETMVYTDNAPKRPFWYVSGSQDSTIKE